MTLEVCCCGLVLSKDLPPHCPHCHDDPPRCHTCPRCGQVASEALPDTARHLMYSDKVVCGNEGQGRKQWVTTDLNDVTCPDCRDWIHRRLVDAYP